MFDTQGRAAAASHPPPKFDAEFYTVELSKLIDGAIRVALTATTIDEEDAGLLHQEIATQRVPTLDDALALVQAHVRFV